MTWHVWVIAAMTAFPFGVWQKSMAAGVWMYFVAMPVIIIAGKQ